MTYEANPVRVEAHQIRDVRSHAAGGFTVQLATGEWRHASAEMCARMTPCVGDYWVIQQDGYEYLNPQSVFERKYRLVEVTA